MMELKCDDVKKKLSLGKERIFFVIIILLALFVLVFSGCHFSAFTGMVVGLDNESIKDGFNNSINLYLTAAAISSWDSLKSDVVNTFNNYGFYVLVFIGIILFLIIIKISVRFWKFKKRMVEPKMMPVSVEKSSIEKWSGKKKLSLEKDLDHVQRHLVLNKTGKEKKTGKILDKLNIQNIKQKILEKELSKINADIQGYAAKPTMIEVPKKKQDLDLELANLEKELNGIDESVPRAKIITQIPMTLGHETISNVDIKKMDQELKHVNSRIDKSIKSEDSLLKELMRKRRPAKRIREAEKKAASEVIRISKKIEGSHPLPQNELVEVEQEIKKLRKDFKKKN